MFSIVQARLQKVLDVNSGIWRTPYSEMKPVRAESNWAHEQTWKEELSYGTVQACLQRVPDDNSGIWRTPYSEMKPVRAESN